MADTPNTFYKTPKDDPKDRIQIEIGDSKQLDFYPQVKIMRSGDFKKGHIPWNKGITGYSTSWKGRKMPKEAKEKMRQAHLGRVPSVEQRRKQSEALKGRMPKNLYLLDNSGANSHWWKGGITPENEHQRKNKEFKNWRKEVYERDNYKCKKCGQNTRTLHPHHIMNFSKYVDLRFEADNGVTLCEVDHRRFHKEYGLANNSRLQLKEFLCQQ